MSDKKPTIAMKLNVKDDNLKRGEVRKIVQLVSELKRSKVNVKHKNFGLLTNPVYDHVFDDKTVTNRGAIVFEYLSDENFQRLKEYVEINGGKILERKDKTNGKITSSFILIDTSSM